ncbi:MAG: 16S rRNA (adenine(1518)-N(6)/adenine(1519)-N(6))-dimethyltransferase RsmA [Synergistaceae bacterium]|jgi:16S rRNA (adenine1518-N6/adenine1519-N6)-dimethyltransferase|nr:16S rRNA (adenine(1518)-N(6)/adenine(1519)-N(6))-dimethyltransferase RsmA [Synergistaceae bacterium]
MAGTPQSEFFRAKKRLGQNFLVDRGILTEIVERAQVSPDDTILEVGPGTGVLTRELLLKKCSRLFAVEMDLRLKDTLESLSAEFGSQLSLVWGDAVRIDYDGLFPFPNKAVANIPYNITTPLIWRLLAFAPRGLNYHLYMVQKEAADRLTAKRDTKERYPLGVALEVMGEVKLVRKVPPACFRPIPRVESALVEIRLTRGLYLMEDSRWSSLLHAGFRQRRKTLVNNLKDGGLEIFAGGDAGAWASLLERLGIDPKARAEDLSGEEWLALHDACPPRLERLRQPQGEG